MAREIKGPITLRITRAEIIESQLSADDLQALAPAAEDGTLCPGTYCSGGYSGPSILEVESALGQSAAAEGRP